MIEKNTWTSFEPPMPCLGGGELHGTKWVRKLYLDESGIGKLENDPFLVVAGVLIHADTQWRPMSEKLRNLLLQAVPDRASIPKYLHAKDIFHGTGDFHREVWDQPRRIKLLEDVSKLPNEFNVPVVWASVDRRDLAARRPNSPPVELVQEAYLVATMSCLMQVEIYMRTQPDELVSVTLEENRELQKRMPEIMDFTRDRSKHGELIPGSEEVVPFNHIIDNPSHQPKSATGILQMADYCAFAIKRQRQQMKDAINLTTGFAQQLMQYRGHEGSDGRPLWNPKFMPHLYPKLPVLYRAGLPQTWPRDPAA